MRTKLLAVALSVAIFAPATGFGQWAVIDATSIVQETKILTEAKKAIEEAEKRLEKLNELSQKAQAQIDAIGKVGQVALPIFNAVKMANRLKRDAQCLLPDLSSLYPSLDFAEVDMDSICSLRDSYRDALWWDPEKALKKGNLEAGLPGGGDPWDDPNKQTSMTWAEQGAARDAVLARRDATVAAAALDGLAQADIAIKASEDEDGVTANEIETQAKAAQDVKEMMAVNVNAQVALIRTISRQNQVLAQLLKVQSAYVLRTSVPITQWGEGAEVVASMPEAGQ